MRKTKAVGNFEGILLDRATLCAYLNMGSRNAEKIAEDARARMKFGKSVRYYRPAIDEYLKYLIKGDD